MDTLLGVGLGNALMATLLALVAAGVGLVCRRPAVVHGLSLAGLRIGRFRRLLRHAHLAPTDLQEQSRRLAQRLGLAHGPEVWCVPAPVSPLLWTLAGRPRILLPAALWKGLKATQRDALL